MRDPVDPIQPIGKERRSRARRSADRRAPAAEPALPMVIEAAPIPEPERPEAQGSAIFAAQLLGQPGEKRGLRGGPETLEKARAAYLEAEWSGPGDRREAPGRSTAADI